MRLPSHYRTHRERGYLLVEMAVALFLFALVAAAAMKSMVASVQSTAVSARMTVTTGALDNYQELARSADITSSGTSVGMPVFPISSASLFTIPSTANTWSQKSTTLTSPIDGSTFPVTTFFLWKTPSTIPGGLQQVEYHIAIEMPQADLPGMETVQAAAAKPFRFERIIVRSF